MTIDVTVSALGRSAIDLVFIITPFTFDEYDLQFGKILPAEILRSSQNTDRAECEFLQPSAAGCSRH